MIDASKLNANEKRELDAALTEMLARLDNYPAHATRLCVLRAQIAPDNVFEFRVIRYPTAAEWATAIEFIKNLSAADLVKKPAPPKRATKKGRKKK